MKFIVLGSGARENIIIQKLCVNPENFVYCISTYLNPQIKDIVCEYKIVENYDLKSLLKSIIFIFHQDINQKTIVIPAAEKFLEIGIVDELLKHQIPCIGPLKNMAMIETSKTFCRNYLQYNHLDHFQPSFFVIYVYNEDKIKNIFQQLDFNFVIKADGLCGGKGVREYDASNWETALPYAKSLLDIESNFYQPSKFIIEEKLIGEEFSLLSFCDGLHIKHMPAVQDYKNLSSTQNVKTGGMGTVVLPTHSFPFLDDSDILKCQNLNDTIMKNLSRDSEYGYRGILYGGFMKTKQGIKLIEYNARFGDPECLNLLSLLETPLDIVFRQIVNQKLNEIEVSFKREYCICRYLVPPGYPSFQTSSGFASLDLEDEYPKSQIIMAAIQQHYKGNLQLMNSRSIALVSQNTDLKNVLDDLVNLKNKINTNLMWREDIGSQYVSQISYQDCGVNVEEGNLVVSKIKDAVTSTHNDFVVTDYGGFSGIYDITKFINSWDVKHPVLVSSTDGVGTKTDLVLEVLGEERGLFSLGQDIVGHSVNDIAVLGAKPLYFMDYIASSKINSDNIRYLLEGMSQACQENELAILGGETAEMPGVYQDGKYDIVGTIIGIVDSQKMIKGKENIVEGDVVLALGSKGPHTNGYSLIRKLVTQYLEKHPDKKLDDNLQIGGISMKDLIQPHKSYYSEIKNMLEEGIDIHGLCHITGGGFQENIPRVLPDGLGVTLNAPIIEPFSSLQRLGNLSNEEMYRVFNCGYGMLVIVSPNIKDKIIKKYYGIEIGYVNSISPEQEIVTMLVS